MISKYYAASSDTLVKKKLSAWILSDCLGGAWRRAHRGEEMVAW